VPPIAPRPSGASSSSSPPSTAPACPPSTRSPRASTSGDKSCSPYFDESTTNGYAEGVINKIKVTKRRAYGIPTFTAFRHRVLLACG
jgi:hypothetical protein